MCNTSAKPLFTGRELLTLIWPLVVEQLLAVTVGMADTVMVSSVGEEAVSGIALVDSINILFIQIFSAMATGGAVVASQYLGRQDRESACSAAKQLLYTALILSLVILAAAYPFQRSILSGIFGSIEPEVMANAQTYFGLSLLSYPFLALYNGGAALFRAMGNSRISMLTSLLMNVVNIGGNAILIYGCGWGVAGAATASLFSRALSAVLITVLICRPHQMISVHRLFRPEFRPAMVRRILSIGIPGGVENGMFQIGKLIVQQLVSTFGTFAISANAIANNIASVVNVPGTAIQLALITVVGRCIGAQDYGQAVSYTKRLLGFTYLSMGTLNLLLLLTAHPLVGVFHLSTQATAAAEQVLYLFAVCSMLLWPLSFITPNALRAAGDAKFTMVVSMVSMWVFRIGFSYLLADDWGLGLGLLGVWMAMVIDWVARAAVFSLRFLRGKWKNLQVI